MLIVKARSPLCLILKLTKKGAPACSIQIGIRAEAAPTKVMEMEYELEPMRGMKKMRSAIVRLNKHEDA